MRGALVARGDSTGSLFKMLMMVTIDVHNLSHLFRPADFYPLWAADAQIQSFFCTLKAAKTEPMNNA